MSIVARSIPVDNTTVSYARLYDVLECYAIQTPAGTLVIDHDQHVYALTADHLGALTLLGAVPQVERANVLAALALAGEVA